MNAARRMTLYEALRAAVEACGGTKIVGAAMWPTKHPEDAGRECGHCIQPGHKRKFDPHEIDFLRDWCQRIGAIDPWCAWEAKYECELRQLNRDAIVIELQTRAVELAQEAAQLNNDIAAISDLTPATLALMQHAHLRVGDT